MRTPAIAAALAAAALIVPAAAVAKEVKEGSVCGASGCRTVTDKSLLMALVDGGGVVSDPPQAGPFFRVTVVMEAGPEEHSFETQMVPSRDALRGADGTWMELPTAAESALKTVAGDTLEPLPASQLEGAALPLARAPSPAPESGGLSGLERVLVLGALILIAAGFIAVSRGHRPALRRRPGGAPSS